MDDSTLFCRDCKANTKVVVDHSAGDTICTECGLVLEERSIDETAEWRTFANESGDPDPNRVGDRINPLLEGAGLSTTISKNLAGKQSDLGRFGTQGPSSDQNLTQAFKIVQPMADRLGLLATVKDLACELYKKVEDLKPAKGRKQDAVAAACLYIACQQKNASRSVKEICAAANGVKKKEILQMTAFIEKRLEVEIDGVQVDHLLRRFCSSLGMNNEAIKAAQKAVQNAEKFDIRRNPETIVAGIIYMMTQLSEDKKSIRDISVATGTAENTIKLSYKDLYPHAAEIIPESYATEEDLQRLCRP